LSPARSSRPRNSRKRGAVGTRVPIVCYVTDRHALGANSIASLLGKIRFAVQNGVDWVQIREKDLAGGPLLALVQDAALAARKRRQNAARIYVNDRLDVALAARAAGVHLGGESLPLGDVVRWCRKSGAPDAFQVGASCHTIETAREAQTNGANYVFFGPVFDTPSKRVFGKPQGLGRLREVCAALRIPVIAIGGVNENNAEECIRAGASGIAAIRFFQEANPEKLKKFISTLHSLDIPHQDWRA
jgi:thiamine-phosphate pyrophosphorylase